MDNSILEGERGATAFIDNARVPFGKDRNMVKLGPLHSTTDTKLLSIRLASDHISSYTN